MPTLLANPFDCGFAALCDLSARRNIGSVTSMAGYVIANVVWKDPESLAVYKRLMPPSVAKYGGRFLVRGGASRCWREHGARRLS